MTQTEALEARVTQLETRVNELSEHRGLTEVRGELRDFRRAVNSNFNAMREDLNDLRDSVGVCQIFGSGTDSVTSHDQGVWSGR